MKILIVEDDQWLGDCYAQWLGKAGYNVLRAGSAQAALDVLDEHKADAILLDLLLPHANGIQFLHQLASYADLATTPVILCSSALPAHTRTLRHYGVVAMLDKITLTPEILRQTIREATYNHAASIIPD